MSEFLFDKCRVYYSGSIRGVPEPDPEFAWKLVQFMSNHGAEVLSAHVAARNPEEMARIRSAKMGNRAKLVTESDSPWIEVRRQDLEWVDQATHVVALINSPSHGVGMELQHALLKPIRGLNETPILALVRQDLAPKVTFMIKGIQEPGFELKEYSDLNSATSHIAHFLLGIS